MANRYTLGIGQPSTKAPENVEGPPAVLIRNSEGVVRGVFDPVTGYGVYLPVILGQQNLPQSKSDANASESASLFTLDIPANTLGPNSSLEIMTLWSVPNSAATKRLRGRFGGVVLWNLDLTTHLTLQLPFFIRNRNSLSSQVFQANSTTVFGPIGSVGVQTSTIDFGSAQQFTVTAQWPVAGAGANNIVLESAIVKHNYGP